MGKKQKRITPSTALSLWVVEIATLPGVYAEERSAQDKVGLAMTAEIASLTPRC
ncbi:MAG: hypothetical protein HY529_00410 [Chloroflexi bacterium]|nr:hypothetical protein [Chloroflexota bacterium]